jgi:hypothetical protein
LYATIVAIALGSFPNFAAEETSCHARRRSPRRHCLFSGNEVLPQLGTQLPPATTTRSGKIFAILSAD